MAPNTKKLKVDCKMLTFNWFGEYVFEEGAKRDATILNRRSYLTKITKRQGFYQLWYRHKKEGQGKHPKTDAYGRL